MTTSWAPDAAFWRSRPTLITGATGFLGSHVTEVLVAAGAEVVAVIRDQVPLTPIAAQWLARVTTVTGDLTDGAFVDRVVTEYEPQTVVHLAAQSQVGVANTNPVSTFEANIRGTWHLLDALRRVGTATSIVGASTDKAYGSQPVLPYDEDMPLLAQHPYDASKACADILARTYAHSYELPIVTTRCGNLYGPGDLNWKRLIPGTIRSVLRGERPIIRSDGLMVRDYLYVTDAAEAYLRLAEAVEGDADLRGEAFNLATGEPLTVLEVVALIQQAAGTSLAPDVLGIATNEIPAQYLSSRKAQRRLGWTAEHSAEAGLAATVAWYADLPS